MRCRLLVLLAALAVPGLSRDAAAQPTLRVQRVSEPPTIDQYLGGSPLPGSTPVTGFVQREPGDGVPASQRTAAYVSYDDENLYVIFVCRDAEPDKVRARLTRRENFGGDDAVGVLLDTFHDRRRSYVFLVNPLGIQMDGIVAEGQEDDYSFDTLWRSEGRLTPFGYVVRIELPFKSLRFPAAAAQTWGVALARLIPRANETSFWPYITRRVAGFGQQLATLEGLERISPGRNLQFIPYGAFAAARTPGTLAGSYDADTESRAGLDAKLVVKDAFTVDLALNPDFSQVESDEPQVTINERFEVFFPERRPFFIENATYFETPIQLFFSRRVADPQFGGRITGKAGGWAIGALAIDDRAPGRVDVDPSLAGERAGVAVVRAQRDFGEQSSVGLFVTNRDFADSFSRVASADGRVKLNANWVAQGQLAFSRTAGLDGQAESGAAWTASLSRESRTFQYGLSFQDIAPDFRVPLGFVQRVDLRQVRQRAGYTWRPEGGRIVGFGPEMIAWAIWDHGGRLQEWFFSPEFEMELRGPTSLGIDHREQMELFQGTEFRKRSTELSVRSEWLEWLSGSIEYSWGSEVNFIPASGIRPFLGSARAVEAGLTFRPSPRLRLDQTYLYSGLDVRDPLPLRPDAGPGASVFRNHIFRTRTNYQFTRELSLRAIVDYAAILPDSGLAALDRRKDATADILLTYLLNPGTAVYFGYTDRYESLRMPFGGGEPGFGPEAFRSTGRQVFVKASYLLRF